MARGTKIRIGASLIFGVLVTLGVAAKGWWDMAVVVLMFMGFSHDEIGYYLEPATGAPWLFQVRSIPFVSWCFAERYGYIPTPESQSDTIGGYKARGWIEKWPEAPMGITPTLLSKNPTDHEFQSFVVGRPFRCLRAVWTQSGGIGDFAYHVIEGIDGARWIQRSVTGPRCTTLPTHILWPGLLGDVAVAAVPMFVALQAWPAYIGLLVRRRRRAGLCEMCGYSRSGLAEANACPECGAVPAK